MANALKTLIRFRCTNGSWVWVKSVSWGDGPGNRVKKVSFSKNRDEAFGFSTAMAQDVATQYSHRDVRLEREDGQASDAQAYVDMKNTATRAHRVAIEREFNEALRPLATEIVRILNGK